MSLDEDQALLKAVRDWRPPKTLHPSAIFAARLYDENNNTLPPEAVQKLRDGLDQYGDDLIGLAEACEGLTRFVLLMQNRGDEETGTKVASLMREYTHLFEPFWEQVGEALENVGADANSLFQQFVDANREENKTAPVHDAPPPKDSVPLKNLIQPARPPPWAKKSK